MPAAVGCMGVLQLTQGGATVPLAMLRDHGGGNVARVHQRATLWESSCGVNFLVECVWVVCSTETLGSIAGATGRVGPIGKTQRGGTGLVRPLVGDDIRGSPAAHEPVIRPAVVDTHCTGLESGQTVVRVESPDRA